MPKATRILSQFDDLPTGELVDQLGSVARWRLQCDSALN